MSNLPTTTTPRWIRIQGARQHHLQNLDLDIPLQRWTNVSGVSGAGKSTLVSAVLLAEGQRRYIETFPTGLRRHLEKIDRPDVDWIDGVPPAIDLDFNSPGYNTAGDVGSITELDEDITTWFCRSAQVVCPQCQTLVLPAHAALVRDWIQGRIAPGEKYLLAFPWAVRALGDCKQSLELLRHEGYHRIALGDEIRSLDDTDILDRLASEHPRPLEIQVVADRLIRGRETDERLLESIEAAFDRGLGRCFIIAAGQSTEFDQSWRCGGCGRPYLPPETRLFEQSSTEGGCRACESTGRQFTPRWNELVPDDRLSLAEGAVQPWSSLVHPSSTRKLVQAMVLLGIPTDQPFAKLTPESVRILEVGSASGEFGGLKSHLLALERKANRSRSRPRWFERLAQWREVTTCPDCEGTGLSLQARALRVDHHTHHALRRMPVSELANTLETWLIGQRAPLDAERTARSLLDRLRVLEALRLGHLSLDRPLATLSDGEARFLMLSAALGWGLVHVLYILDEPSSGLHPRDLERWIAAVRMLRNQGNTVLVADNHPALIAAADHQIELGPGAGSQGGRLIFQGPPDTAALATISDHIDTPASQSKPPNWLELKEVRAVHLQLDKVRFALARFNSITGVMGSGKTTLMLGVLDPALRGRVDPTIAREVRGVNQLGRVVRIDSSTRSRIGRRAIPASIVRAYDDIRSGFAATAEAQARGYSAGKFSLHVDGGRCDHCEGAGVQSIDLSFLPDILIPCSVCKGSRFRAEVLEVTFRGKSIAEVLDLTAREAFGFFRDRPRVRHRLRPLLELGLDALPLGRPVALLSKGEQQRLKLAAHLVLTPGAAVRSAAGAKVAYLIENPSAGLHPRETAKVLTSLRSLVDLGHTVVATTNDPQVLKESDWIIELGDGPGPAGGRLVFEGDFHQFQLSAAER